jgi:hypothetical protein
MKNGPKRHRIRGNPALLSLIRMNLQINPFR